MNMCAKSSLTNELTLLFTNLTDRSSLKADDESQNGYHIIQYSYLQNSK